MSGLRDALAEVAAVLLPLPGSGDTSGRLFALSEVARRDLELARLAEAHYDAQAIAAEMGADLVENSLYGVWAASGPDPLVARRTPDGFAISGTVAWCTGVGIVDRALVTASSSDAHGNPQGLLLDVAVADATVVDDGLAWVSPAFAATRTASMRFAASLPASALIGGPDSYLDRPGFWHGAICVSACWVGGVRGLLDRYQQRWRRDDPHALAHLGSAAAWVDALDAVLGRAGTEIDTNPSDIAAAQARARSVRHVIERACVTVMDDLAVGAGPEPLAYDADILQRTQQLQLYIRQCHGERDLAPLGKFVMDKTDRSR